MKKGIFIYRLAAFYRSPIYKKIDIECEATFHFCKNPKIKIKMMDYYQLSRVKLDLKEISLPFGLYYLKGILGINLSSFEFVFIGGDIRDVSSWFLLLKCSILHKPIYCWSHAWYGKENWLIKIVKHFYYSLSKGIFLYGKYAYDLMISNGFDRRKLHIIYNSMDFEQQVQLRDQLKTTPVYKNIFSNNHPVLVFIGRLESYKKLDMILYVINKLEKDNMFLNVCFIGDGPERERLIALSKSLNLVQRVCFHPSCYDEIELSNLIYNAELCISPGNIGLTAMHCLVYGTPIITHNKFSKQGPEFEAIYEGLNGAFFEYNSLDSLVETIKSWINLHPNKTKQLINSCFDPIDKFYNPNYQIELIKKTIL